MKGRGYQSGPRGSGRSRRAWGLEGDSVLRSPGRRAPGSCLHPYVRPAPPPDPCGLVYPTPDPQVLLPRFGLPADPHYDPRDDWLDDNKGLPYMDFPNFFDAMFEVGAEATAP